MFGALSIAISVVLPIAFVCGAFSLTDLQPHLLPEL
jgi:hypothetical protein